MEQKTKSMAAAYFSSSNIVDDLFSQLPEEIMHMILGLLPCIKDVVRTSAISKLWLQVWRTFPVPEFNLEDFACLRNRYSSGVDEAKSKQFIGFVDSTLQRFGRQNVDGIGDGMKVFVLKTVNSMADHTTRWVGMALDNKVEHLSLRIINDTPVQLPLIPASPLLIPDRVLSTYWLKSLILVGFTIYLPLNEDGSVNLPSLTSLRIERSNITNKQLQKLLSGCPVLECITLLGCLSLSRVKISDQPNLETLEVSTRVSIVKVLAPKLKSFRYIFTGEGDVVVKILNSPELKNLSVYNVNKTDEWFHKFIAQFPLIEYLKIESCHILRKIRISNSLLKGINIWDCNNLEDVIISCEKLTYFLLLTTGYSIPKPYTRIEMDNPPNYCEAGITIESDQGECELLMEPSWYCKIKEFLTRSVTFKSLFIAVLGVSAADGDMKGEDVHKKLPPVACTIENLRLEVCTDSFCHSHILNGLLSACHPTIIDLSLYSNDDFVKVVCQELGNRENIRKCCCKDDFRCWKHQLKDVKIEKIVGMKMEEDLDWDALIHLLPTLKEANDIHFKLTW